MLWEEHIENEQTQLGLQSVMCIKWSERNKSTTIKEMMQAAEPTSEKKARNREMDSVSLWKFFRKISYFL